MKNKQKKIIFICVILLTVFIVFAIQATAHPGGTDENGGHYDHSTGDYHYHHGYPAHYHTNGTCPYDFDDRTGWNSGSSSGSSVATTVPSTSFFFFQEETTHTQPTMPSVTVWPEESTVAQPDKIPTNRWTKDSYDDYIKSLNKATAAIKNGENTVAVKNMVIAPISKLSMAIIALCAIFMLLFFYFGLAAIFGK